MIVEPTHLTVVLGDNSLAADLRRLLVQEDIQHFGVTTHLRGLRSGLVSGEHDHVVVCILLDQVTLNRHGEALQRLLDDRHNFSGSLQSVGMLTDLGLSSEAASLGCDIYVDRAEDAYEMSRLLSEHHHRLQAAAHASKPHGYSARSMWMHRTSCASINSLFPPHQDDTNTPDFE